MLQTELRQDAQLQYPLHSNESCHATEGWVLLSMVSQS